MNSISLVAFETRKHSYVFVKDPSLRGRYLRTDKSVLVSECPACNAFKGEPCFTLRQGLKVYSSTTHYVRRRAARNTIPDFKSETDFIASTNIEELANVVGELQFDRVLECIAESFDGYDGSSSQVFKRNSES